MSTSTTGDSYYIRVRGKVLGPYSIKQLSILRQRGQFSQSNEISKNGQDWESAARLDELFAAPTKPKPTKGTDGQDSFVVASSQGEAVPWHYSIDNRQLGPATTADLKELLETGQLSANDLVWREGMADWVPVADVAELKRYISSAKTLRRNQLEKLASDESGPPVLHFLDYVVEGLRSLVPASSLKDGYDWGVALGKYAIYVSIALSLTCGFLLAVKRNSLDVGVLAVGYSILALGAQYTAVRCCRAITQLLQATAFRVSSRAFFDSLVILLLLGGPVFLTAGAVASIRGGEYVSFVLGFVLFLACEVTGLAVLHPEAMGIQLASDTRVGEEAIAIISFILMLPLRYVSGVFGIGVFISIIGTAASIYLYLQIEPNSSISSLLLIERIARESAKVAIGCSLYPLIAYVYFLLEFLFIDVLKAILEIPRKIDRVEQAIRHED